MDFRVFLTTAAQVRLLGKRMKTRYYYVIVSLVVLTTIAGCSTTLTRSDPFLVSHKESEAQAEGALRSAVRRADRIKQIDPRFAVHIPYLHLTNATLETALSELNKSWIRELGTTGLPVVVKLDYRPSGDPPYEGYPGLRANITLTAHDLTVAELLVLIADISPYRLQFMGNTPVLECRHWIEEGWETHILPVSPAGRRYLGLTDSTTSAELSERLSQYGITFPDGCGFYARWNPDIGKLVVFNYPAEIDKLRAIFTLIDNGFEVRRTQAQQSGAPPLSEGAR